MQLPATVRAEFENDPAKLLDFMDNEKNHDKAREMGLLPQLAQKVEPNPSANPTTPSAASATPQNSEQGGSSE